MCSIPHAFFELHQYLKNVNMLHFCVFSFKWCLQVNILKLFYWNARRLIQKIALENGPSLFEVLESSFRQSPDIPSGYFLLQRATYFLTKKISRLYAGPNKSYYENGRGRVAFSYLHSGNCDCFYWLGQY